MCDITMPKRKDISNDLREAIVAAHQSGKGYKAISKLFGVPSFYREKDYSQVENIQDSLPRSGRPSKFSPKSERAMLRETKKKNP